MRLPPLHECIKHLSLILNVRGLNQQAQRDTVHQLIAATSCNIACLQETKLSQICQYDASYLGGHRLSQFAYKPASGPSQTRGGIIILWNECRVSCTDITIGEFHVSANVQLKDSDASFLLTVTTTEWTCCPGR